MVGGFAGRRGAGVGECDDRKTPQGRGKLPAGQLGTLDHPESIPAQSSRLLGDGSSAELTGVTVHAAARPLWLFPQVPAGDPNDRIDVEIAPIVPDLPECHPLGMSCEPRGLVIERGQAILERPYAEGHPKGLAV